jgi:hypothetical protein
MGRVDYVAANTLVSSQKLFNRTPQEHQYHSWLTRVGLPCLTPDCCAIFTAGRSERCVLFNDDSNF